MRARQRAITSLFLTAAVLAAGCTSSSGVTVKERTSAPTESGPDTTTDDTSPDTTGAGPDTTLPVEVAAIEWGECDDEAVTEGELECATLDVPLDYEEPAGETIGIVMVRVPATDDREGAILFNPGGPGGSGFDFVAYSGTYIQSELGLGSFDLIGFDPRGVDRSGGIRCVDDEFQDTHLYLDDTPDTPEEEALLETADTGFTEGCKTNYGDTLRHYSTVNTARDMDLIRAGMGDEQMSYLGISYGTYLGGVYATLFPERVRAMVLDSAFEPSGDTVEQQYLTQLVGFENAFNDWVAWCQEDATCPFTAADVGARWEALRLQLDENPLTVDGRGVNQSTLDRATTAALYTEAAWPVLASNLAQAEAGNGAGLLQQADDYEGRNADGTFNTLFQSIGIIRCASGMVTEPTDDPEGLLEKIREQAPRFGADVTLEDLIPEEGEDYDGCNELTGPAELVQIDYSGDGPIVVVGGKNDPATPYRWAEEMAAAMGPNARLLPFNGEGHGQLLASECVTEIEAALLTDLELPDEGIECNPDPKVERPDWFDSLPVPADFGAPTGVAAVNGALGITDTLGYSTGHYTSLSLDEATTLANGALEGSDGFDFLDEFDLEIDGTTANRWFGPNDSLLLVIVLGPEAFETDDLAGAGQSVPAGQTVVIYLYIPG